MHYLQKKFSTSLGGKKYAEGFDKIDWGRKEVKKEEVPLQHAEPPVTRDGLEKLLTGEESV